MSKDNIEPEERYEGREAIVFDADESAATQPQDGREESVQPDATPDATPVSGDAAADEPIDESADRPTLADVLRDGVTEEDKVPTATYNLGKVLGGDLLSNAVVRSQVWVLLLIVFFLVIYISNRYSYQQRLIKINRMNTELQDAKYRALSSTSALTEKCRESRVLDRLKATPDSTLQIPVQPPYIIKVPKE